MKFGLKAAVCLACLSVLFLSTNRFEWQRHRSQSMDWIPATQSFSSTPTRKYAYAYGPFNSLASATVSQGNGSGAITLLQNYFDGNTGGQSCGTFMFNSTQYFYTQIVPQTGMNEHASSYNTTFMSRGNITASAFPGGFTCTGYDIGGTPVASNQNGLTVTSNVNSQTNFVAPTQMTAGTLTPVSLGWTGFMGLQSQTGMNNDTTTFSYDPASGRPTQSQTPYGVSSNFYTYYTYNDTPQQAWAKTQAGAHITTNSFDGLGRTAHRLDGDTSGTQSETDYTYQPFAAAPTGLLGKQSVPYKPGGPTPAQTVYTYDGLGRKLTVTAPDGASVTNYSYTGNMATVTDPALRVKKFTHDAFGNLIEVDETDPQLGPVSTYYTYDLLNHLTQVRMPRGTNTQCGQTNVQCRTFNYDATTQRLMSVVNPENGTVSYTYNSDGTMATKIDAKGQQFTYSYDGMKRMTQVSLIGTGVLRTYYYDTNPFDAAYSTNATGRPAAVLYTLQNGDTVTEMFGYHAGGMVTAKRLRVGRPNGGATATGDLNATFVPDAQGRLSSESYPAGGPAYTYAYDTVSRLNQMTDQNNNLLVNNLQYEPTAQIGQITFFAATETRQYNSGYQLTGISTSEVVNGVMSTVFNMTYGYPASQNNGKIASQTDLLSGEQVNYAYDSLSRLISAVKSDHSWGQGYNYDGFGNLTAKTVLYGSVPTMSVGVDPSTNHLIGYSFDANGNMTTSPNTGSVTYDSENRLLSTASGSYLYGYDSSNKRVWTKTPSYEHYNFFGPDGNELGAYTLAVNGTVITFTASSTRAYFGTRLVSQDGTHPFIQDVTFSMRVDGSGNKGGFYPYGESKSTPFGYDQVNFATYTRDSGTQLDYADQRFYTSNYGRFMTPDPYTGSAHVRSPQSWNRYMYVIGDPINGTDPSGLDLVAGTCGASAVPNAALTGPPAACNTVGAGAWQQGLPSYTAPPTGLSQTGTPTDFDPTDIDYGNYSQRMLGLFWGGYLWSDPCGALPAEQKKECVNGVFRMSSGLVCTGAIVGTVCVPAQPSQSNTPPASTTFTAAGATTDPNNPTVPPTCGAGFHPLGFVVWTCVPIPVPPPVLTHPAAPIIHRPPGRDPAEPSPRGTNSEMASTPCGADDVARKRRDDMHLSQLRSPELLPK